VLTVTSTVAAACAGETTVACVAEFTVIEPLAAAVVPNSTVIPAANPVPVIVTVVPPAIGPALGEMPVIVGLAR
jgi:hypothetical protein